MARVRVTRMAVESTGQALGSFRISLETSRAPGEGPHNSAFPGRPRVFSSRPPLASTGLAGDSTGHVTQHTQYFWLIPSTILWGGGSVSPVSQVRTF